MEYIGCVAVFLLILYGDFVSCDFYIPNRVRPYEYETDGDVFIGITLEIKETTNSKPCDGELDSDSISLPMALLYTVRQINDDPSLLRNISLGLRMIGDCGNSAGRIASGLELISRNYDEQNELRPLSERIIGIVAGVTSTDITKMAEVFQYYQIPHFGLHATSDALSNKEKYPYFARVIPPDKFQTQAMLDLVLEFEWKYVSIVFNQDTYGLNGYNTLKDLLVENDVCIADSIPLEQDSDDKEKSRKQGVKVGKRLMRNPNSRVILVFAFGRTRLESMMKTMAEDSDISDFIFLFSDGYRFELNNKHDDLIFVNYISIGVSAEVIPAVDTYLNNLEYKDVQHLPWAEEFRNQKNCGACNGSTLYSYGGGSYSPSYRIEPVRALAFALDTLIKDKCPDAAVHKDLLDNCTNGPDLLKYLYNVSFNSSMGPIELNENGDGSANYIIRQVQIVNDKATVVPVAKWNRINHLVHETSFQWIEYNTSGPTETEVPESKCSEPCDSGYFRINTTSCCWICRRCHAMEIVTDDGYNCSVCPTTTWPDSDTFSSCIPIDPTHTDILQPMALFTTGLSLIFSAICLGCVIIYFIHREDRMVKASSHSLSNIILVGLLMSYVGAVFNMLEPVTVVCVVQRFAFSLGTCIVYAPVMVKSIRVYRIFSAGAKGKQRPIMISTNWQLIFISMLITLQVVISTTMAVLHPPLPQLRQPIASKPYVEKFCSLPTNALIIPLSYNMLIIITAAFYGYKTRKLPENFNESKCIFISVCATLFLWIAFCPVFYTTNAEANRSLLLSMSMILSSAVILITLFFTRIYALYYVDESNIHFMTTTTNASRVGVIHVPSVSSTVTGDET